jgi:UDP-D-galactose:(glucosyl)LPS alpha-1,6-D-galactosyltransferase
VNDLLAAAARLSGEFRLVILGDGTGRQRLLQYGEELGLSNRIEWLGWKSDPWASVQQASALVLTSSYEGLPMILIEALAHGVPCISSDCKFGPDEIVQEGNNGWLYPVGNIDALIQRMQRIIDSPEILPEQEGLCTSVERFSTAAVAERAHRALSGEGNRV